MRQSSQALREAAEDAGLLDGDLLALDAFVGARTRYEAGEIDAGEAARAMRDLRPRWFERDWRKMGDKEFRDRSERLLEGARRRAVGPERPSYSDLDAAKLTPEQSEALDRVMRGGGDSIDRSVLEAARARQGGA